MTIFHPGDTLVYLDQNGDEFSGTTMVMVIMNATFFLQCRADVGIAIIWLYSESGEMVPFFDI